MKNEGFTLIELLTVLVLLGIISLSAVVAVNKSLDESKQELYDIQINNIIQGARLWADDNVFSLPQTDGENITLTLQQLKDAGLVDKDITNPLTNEPFSNINVIITKNGNNYDFEIE